MSGWSTREKKRSHRHKPLEYADPGPMKGVSDCAKLILVPLPTPPPQNKDKFQTI